MSEPFIFVTTNTINDGQLESVTELSRRFAALAEAHDTGLLAYHFYLNEEGTEVRNVQVHRNAAAMDAYVPLVQELIQQALERTTTTSIDVYGDPGPVVQRLLRMNAEQGVRVHVSPTRLSGFTRSAPA
ncbi:MAG: hypothetical protein ACXVR2_09475 [Solirubrobacteraceae bacterium]